MNSQEEKIRKVKRFLKQFWLNYEIKIITFIGFMLVAIISFEAGMLKGQKWQQDPLVIEKPIISHETCQTNPDNNLPQTQNTVSSEKQNITSANTTVSEINSQIKANCVFVGSKNSNKYHLPTCRWAKQIKPENLVCFSSVEDAVKKGYQPDKNCIK